MGIRLKEFSLILLLVFSGDLWAQSRCRHDGQREQRAFIVVRDDIVAKWIPKSGEMFIAQYGQGKKMGIEIQPVDKLVYEEAFSREAIALDELVDVKIVDYSAGSPVLVTHGPLGANSLSAFGGFSLFLNKPVCIGRAEINAASSH